MKKIEKHKILKALENKNKDEDNGKCYLVIIPFVSKKEANQPEFKKYVGNLLEVDDEFYEEILEYYKDYKSK